MKTESGHLAAGGALVHHPMSEKRAKYLRDLAAKDRAKRAALDKIKADPLNWGKK